VPDGGGVKKVHQDPGGVKSDSLS